MRSQQRKWQLVFEATCFNSTTAQLPSCFYILPRQPSIAFFRRWGAFNHFLGLFWPRPMTSHHFCHRHLVISKTRHDNVEPSCSCPSHLAPPGRRRYHRGYPTSLYFLQALKLIRYFKNERSTGVSIKSSFETAVFFLLIFVQQIIV